jgi:NAD-dependent SIR2 family protein deacetylase
MSDLFVTLAYCQQCKQELPVNITEMKKDDMTIHIVACCVCDAVLNLREDIKIRDITEEDFQKEFGWERMEGDDNV